ncbi:hypothetical protein AMTR_s00144p00056560 [Amborella trichopoda]|uniref:Aminotransferase-like plant mobile domain-containing protein n=2 Tax=Amborella trichopoda TaxID=13333 RepID=W1P7N1_AMBTC|nr:hypothetical protein AMTR_s00144p00056560 [Amborella trichopoda]
MEAVGQYAWSAAALAFLFRALSKVVCPDHQHLSGSTTLLLVIWTPYDDYHDLGEETEEDKDYDLIVHQITLCRKYPICGNICEGYIPNRVLRQLGLHQGILADPLQWERRERKRKRTEN